MVLRLLVLVVFALVPSGGVTDWHEVIRLREWASEHIDLGTRASLLDRGKAGADYYSRTADWIFKQFDKDRGGVWCGGAAYALQQLYLKHGFEAWTYDSGIPGVMTHVVTIVKIRHQGRALRVVQDATLNVAYGSSLEGPLDIADLYRLVRARDAGSVKAIGKDVIRDMLVGAGDERPASAIIVPHTHPVKLDNGNTKYRIRMSLATFQKRWNSTIVPALAQRGYPADSVYLFAFPLSMHPNGLALLEE